jgi:ribosomal protein L30/L7E
VRAFIYGDAQTVEQVDSPSLRGMLYKVSHLVEVEEVVE